MKSQSHLLLPTYLTWLKPVLLNVPDRLPHKVGKTGPKRQRTVAVKSSLSASNAITSRRLHYTPLPMADFQENSEEASYSATTFIHTFY